MIAETELTQPETSEKPEFHITSDSAADWYLKQLACYDAEISLLKAQMEAAIKRVQSDRDGLVNLYGAELEAYIGQQLALDKRGRKSIILPHGTCSFRTVPARLELTELVAAVEYARQQGFDVFETRFVPARYKEIAEEGMQETGEVLPGLEVKPARESFSIKFGKDKE